MCVLALVASTGAFAADFSAQYKAAYDDFLNRGDTGVLAQSCVDKALAAFNTATTDVEKYDALVLQSRCLYYVGMKASGDDAKISIFGNAKNVADRAKPFQPNRAEAYYYYGINLGRWAEANGIMKSLGERHNLRRNMESVQAKVAIVDGKTIPGKEYDSYGANRTLGRMYFKLPGMFGGDNQKAERLLREGVVESEKLGERNSLNIQYFAEILVANNKKTEARLVLDDTLRFEGDLVGYNPSRAPETKDEMVQLRALRRELGN